MQTQPVDDIDAVLGRFQAWTGTRNAVEVKPGIRELTPEEALLSCRNRWKALNERPAKKKLDTEPDPKLGPEPGVEPVATPVPPEPEQRKRSAADSKRRTAKKAAPPKHASKTPQHAATTVKKTATPAFREVLAEALRPTEAIVAAQPVELSRQVAISIRLAPAERALIKTRAAEAGITASAYLRRCALEVEQLRAQVQQTLAAIERKAPASSEPSARTQGFFSRMARRWFTRSTPTLALRA